MIRVAPAPEPPHFDKGVRQRGLAAIDELVGKPSRLRRPGRKRQAVAATEADIPASAFPDFWTDAADDLHSAYAGLCAYSALYIEPGTGNPTVDHFVPKSRNWQLVYEWTNYRLACSQVNACKGDSIAVLDPFSIQDDWFELELVGFQVVVGRGARGALRAKILTTIDELGLNRQPLRRQREKEAGEYETGGCSFAHLERYAPFVAHELRRQGRVRAEDA